MTLYEIYKKQSDMALNPNKLAELIGDHRDISEGTAKKIFSRSPSNPIRRFFAVVDEVAEETGCSRSFVIKEYLKEESK